jgi:hypothetical protein
LKLNACDPALVRDVRRSPKKSQGSRQRGQIRAWYDFAYVILRELEQAFCISQGSQLNSPLH